KVVPSLSMILERTPPSTCSSPENGARSRKPSTSSRIYAPLPRTIFPRCRKFPHCPTEVSVSWIRSSDDRFEFFDGTLPRRFARSWRREVSSSLVGGRRGPSISVLRIELCLSVPTAPGTPYDRAGLLDGQTREFPGFLRHRQLEDLRPDRRAERARRSRRHRKRGLRQPGHPQGKHHQRRRHHRRDQAR